MNKLRFLNYLLMININIPFGLIFFLFISGCSYEKKVERESYSSCKGQFEYQGTSYDCKYRIKVDDLNLDVRIIPLNVEDRGFVHKGPFKVIIVVNSIFGEIPEILFEKLWLRGYIGGNLFRSLDTRSVVSKRKVCPNSHGKCTVMIPVFESVDFLNEDNEVVYFQFILKSINKDTRDKMNMYKFLPHIENKIIMVPLFST